MDWKTALILPIEIPGNKVLFSWQRFFLNIFLSTEKIVWTLRPEDPLGIKLVKPGIHHLRNVPMGINSI